MKKLIVFNLDGTLAESKSPLDTEMLSLLHDLLRIVKVAVISGGDWVQFEKQLLSYLPHDEQLKNLSILPTCGTKFFKYSDGWEKIYSEDFTKRKKMKALLNKLIPEFSVRLGGMTSIDITKPGIDKGYGIRKLQTTLGIPINEMIFIGDALFPGGNDYPAKEAGVVSIQVRDVNETKQVIETIIACLE